MQAFPTICLRRAVRWLPVGLLALAASHPAAALVVWTDWTAATLGASGSASGTMGGISVSYSGEVNIPTQIAGGTNYWSPGTPYVSATVPNAPPASDIIVLFGGVGLPANTITFGSPVTNPLMAIVSLGTPGLSVDYTFDTPFDVLSFGPGFWGGPGTLTELAGNVLHGTEGHGTIQFLGTYTTISWTAAPSENWHGFTVGVNPIPEPSTYAMLLAGLALLGFIVRRRVRT